MSLTEQQKTKLYQCLEKGNPIEAVQLVREFAGRDLRQAKVYVYDVLRELQQDSPPVSLGRRQRAVLQSFDNGIFGKIRLLDESSMSELRTTQLHTPSSYSTA